MHQIYFQVLLINLQRSTITISNPYKLTVEEMMELADYNIRLWIRQLAGISNNLNQVAKVFNQEGLFEGMKYFEHYRNLVDGILLKLKP